MFPGGYTLLAIPDVHLTAGCGQVLHPAFRLVHKFIREYQPDVVVVMGDFLDMAAINPHLLKAGNQLELESQRLGADFELGRRLLEDIRKHCRLMHYLEGNHEYWAERLVEKFPGLQGLLNVQEQLHLDQLDIGWTPMNKVFRYGKLNFIHGWFTNKYHARKTLDEMGDHIIYAHTHSHQKEVKPVRANREPYLSMSLGCLCDLNPYYLRNRPSTWLHGFGLFEVVAADATFYPYFIPIINNEFIFDRHRWRL